ncbi:MAG: phosphoadenylyl-sulfate reductase [Pseudodonghicola sp.]|nr:phosphoadenylyl-sulfate reductase [Pseudodonghicola sp.]
MLLLGKNTPAGGSDSAALATLKARTEQVENLNARYRHHGATDVMRAALSEAGHIALVSSFGAESVVLLHMAAVLDRAVPVLFIDTEMLFTETLVYQAELSERLGLRNLQIIRAGDSAKADPDANLHRRDPDACCALRKTRPLQVALTGFDGWITGRKRFQSGRRAALDFFEIEKDSGRIKINPLAHWAPEYVKTYIEENRLPRHPLVAQGYPSIGCAPCTSPVAPGENPRAGRWRGQQKDECGIHFVNGKPVRTGANA